MSVSFFLLLIMILVVLVCLGVPVLLGVYVYGDAKARGMEPLLWALVASLVPGLLGLLVYLTVRRNQVSAVCPQCGTEVQENYVSCPNCGQKLSASCVKCGGALRPGWKLCPACGAEVTEPQTYTPPVIRQGGSKRMTGLVIVALLLPVVLALVVSVMGFVLMARNRTASSTVSSSDLELLVADELMGTGDYYECRILTVSEADLDAPTRQWIRNCQKGKKGIYASAFTRPRSGALGGALGSGRYSLDLAYTVIVLNSGGAVEYDVGGTGFEHIGEGSFPVTENIEQYLIDPATVEDPKERVEWRENAARYGNVFVVVYPASVAIDYLFRTGQQYTLFAETESETMRLVLVDGKKGETTETQYTIPLVPDEGGFYTSFKKVR